MMAKAFEGENVTNPFAFKEDEKVQHHTAVCR